MNKITTSIPELINAFQAARQQLGARGELVKALAEVIAAALERLDVELSQSAGGARPTLSSLPEGAGASIFGGIFKKDNKSSSQQDKPEAAAGKTLADPDEAAYRAGRLFALALRTVGATVDADRDLGHLDLEVENLAEQLVGLVEQEMQAKQQQVTRLSDAVDRLEQLDDQEASLRARKSRAETETETLRGRVDALQGEVAALEPGVETLRAEKARLEAQLREARESAVEIEKLTNEFANMPEQLEKDKAELEALRKKHAEIAEEAYRIREHLKTTKEMVEHLDGIADPAVADKVKAIWQEVPKDLFDVRME